MVLNTLKTLCIGLLTSQAVHAATLMDTKVSSENYSVEAVLEFDSPVEGKDIKVNYINQTVQIDIPSAIVPSGKSRTAVKSDKVRSLYAYQLKPETMRTRIIYEKPIQANMFEGFANIKTEGNRVKVVIEDPESTMSKEKFTTRRLELVPPIDIEAELQPKNKASEIKAPSAAAVLEEEFLSKINDFSEKPIIRAAPKVAKPDKFKTTKKAKPVEATAKVESEDKPENKSADYDEAAIPLDFAKKTKVADVEMPWGRLIISLLVISILGIGVIIFTKKYSKSHSKIGGNIKIQTVSQQSLGPKKSLAVVRVAGEDILIGVTDHHISLIKSLSFIDDEIEEDVPKEFVSELNKVTDSYLDQRRPSAPASAHLPPRTDEKKSQEEYSFANIKDIVSDKLKEMRPL